MNRLITIAACLVAVAAVIYFAFSTKSSFQKKSQQIAGTQPATPVGKMTDTTAAGTATPAADNPAKESPPATWGEIVNDLANGGAWPEPGKEEIEAYLDAHNRSAHALITAYALTESSAYLDEALEADPDNPQLHLAAAMRDYLNDNTDSPWIDRLLESDPDNPLPSWLAANALLEKDDLEGAIAELHNATNKSQFNDYFIHQAQNAEEFYTQRGAIAPVAKAQALFGVSTPHLQPLNNLRKQLDTRIDQLVAAGQTDQAQELALFGIEMGNRLSQGEGQKTIIAELIGLSYEKQFLEAFDPNQSYPHFPQPIPEMLESIDKQAEEIRALAKDFPDIIGGLTEAEAAAYFDRMKLFGEKEAHRWLIERNNSQAK
ncbi:MAG: hypothetical protein AAF591_12425 [Verrucomicrobiota bacterium]